MSGKWSTVSYGLDLSDRADSGQFILGEPLNERNRGAKFRLRSATVLFPEIVDPNLDNDGEPSCNFVEAPGRQEPFLSSTLAQHALGLLARLFRYSEVSYHGGYINLETGVSPVLRIDPQHWKRAPRMNKHSTQLLLRQMDHARSLEFQSRHLDRGNRALHHWGSAGLCSNHG